MANIVKQLQHLLTMDDEYHMFYNTMYSQEFQRLLQIAVVDRNLTPSKTEEITQMATEYATTKIVDDKKQIQQHIDNVSAALLFLEKYEPEEEKSGNEECVSEQEKADATDKEQEQETFEAYFGDEERETVESDTGDVEERDDERNTCSKRKREEDNDLHSFDDGAGVLEGGGEAYPQGAGEPCKGIVGIPSKLWNALIDDFPKKRSDGTYEHIVVHTKNHEAKWFCVNMKNSYGVLKRVGIYNSMEKAWVAVAAAKKDASLLDNPILMDDWLRTTMERNWMIDEWLAGVV
tara:strand:- start:20 stop:892 length:873 start_codon:yes stop_codon:yes gene_type:complete